jgi:hypothetical protein
MRTGLFWVLVGVLAAIGCAAKKPAQVQTAQLVGISQIDHFQPPPEGSPAKMGKRPPLVLPPEPLQQTLPEYPEAALGDAIACVARVLYHVETSGNATLVRLAWVEPPPAEHIADFEEAIGTGISKWRFIPALRVVPEKQTDGSIEPMETPVPTAQHAFVRFRVEDGKAVVE